MATVAAIATIASAAYSVYNASQKSDSGTIAMPPPPPNAPLAPPTLNDPQIDAAGEMERRKAAAAGGIMENIRTSPAGDTSSVSTTGKRLLGA